MVAVCSNVIRSPICLRSLMGWDLDGLVPAFDLVWAVALSVQAREEHARTCTELG